MRSSTHQPARILMVDDNKNGLAARKAVLEELGHHIATANAPEDALELFHPGKFDVLVTDYKMPKMDGVELIRKIREIEPGIPAIILSGYVDSVGLNEANTGADVVLSKSSSEVPQLIRAVNRVLRKKAARKPPATQQSTLKAKRTHA
jgi:CheY-like chemotaxis protein